jgi:hypothetical protein
MLYLLSFVILAAALSTEVTAASVEYDLPITNANIAPDGFTRS